MNKKDFCMSWWVTFIAMLIVLISSFALGSDTDSEHYYLSSFIGEFLMIIPIAVGIIPLILRKRTSEISFKVFSPKLLVFAALIPIASQPFINLFITPINAVTEFLFDTGADTSLPAAASVGEMIFKFLTLLVLAPILEEILCRGILMQYLKRYGLAVSLIVSSLCFALLHFDPTSLVVIFFVGMLLGMIKVSTGSLWASIIAHSVNNLVAMTEFSDTVSTVIFVVSVVLFPILLYLFMRLMPDTYKNRLKFKKGEKIEFSVGAVLSFSLYGLLSFVLVIMKLSSYLINSVF